MNANELIHEYYKKLVSVFPDKPWSGVVFGRRRLANPISSTEFMMIFYLHLYRGPCIWPLGELEEKNIKLAILLQNNILNMMESLQGSDRERLKSRWRAAFQQESDMRALMFEASVYDTFIRGNLKVALGEHGREDGTYDFLVSEGGREWAVECKSFSFFKALNVSQNDAKQILEGPLSELKLNTAPKNQLVVIDLKISQDISRGEYDIESLSKEIKETIEDGVTKKGEVFYSNNEDNKKKPFSFKVTYVDYLECIEKDMSVLARMPLSKDIEIACLLSLPGGNASRQAVRLFTCMKKNSWREFEKVAKTAVKKQLTDKKNSSLFIQILNTDSIKEITSSREFDVFIDKIFSYHHLKELTIFQFPSLVEKEGRPFVNISHVFRKINYKFPHTIC